MQTAVKYAHRTGKVLAFPVPWSLVAVSEQLEEQSVLVPSRVGPQRHVSVDIETLGRIVRYVPLVSPIARVS